MTTDTILFFNGSTMTGQADLDPNVELKYDASLDMGQCNIRNYGTILPISQIGLCSSRAKPDLSMWNQSHVYCIHSLKRTG